jgi:hypothetical protein
LRHIEGRRKKEEGRRKKEEGRGKKEECFSYAQEKEISIAPKTYVKILIFASTNIKQN